MPYDDRTETGGSDPLTTVTVGLLALAAAGGAVFCLVYAIWWLLIFGPRFDFLPSRGRAHPHGVPHTSRAASGYRHRGGPPVSSRHPSRAAGYRAFPYRVVRPWRLAPAHSSSSALGRDPA